MPRSPEPHGSDSSEEGEGEPEYTVEEIRASRWDDYSNSCRYLVKWEGYGEDEKTWEPVEPAPAPALAPAKPIRRSMPAEDILRAARARKAASPAPSAAASAAFSTTTTSTTSNSTSPPTTVSSATGPSAPIKPIPRPAPSPAINTTSRAASPSNPVPHPGHPGAMAGSLKTLSFKKNPAAAANGARFDDTATTTNGVGSSGAAASSARSATPQQSAGAAAPPAPPSAAAAPRAVSTIAVMALTREEQAAKAKRVKAQLMGHEDRLRRTLWCQSNPLFHPDSNVALPLACVQALHIEPHTIMRMKKCLLPSTFL
ncbi:hypothetical protein JCM8547_001844 [Rhodosporidiobolus lusitaniae]